MYMHICGVSRRALVLVSTFHLHPQRKWSLPLLVLLVLSFSLQFDDGVQAVVRLDEPNPDPLEQQWFVHQPVVGYQSVWYIRKSSRGSEMVHCWIVHQHVAKVIRSGVG